ncbi:sugar ABC transporter ATP-binding protein [Rhodoferax saidenbachensis]|uniref:Simple sugar transport system ATP-binding protein n=1 Tax=Rhodoferax saidenbachensis TaxID=1484693 RepID=A0ABU1ZPG2_9BURK|nr:sugar ABC transporter ATP-binding protein [Rhodoferax saidenbachensis]MDR7307425.1 simple sugar transport system ATP-binding protein [Rhodoferax saidenbachensis]
MKKHFAATRALDGLVLDIANGEVLALMGANGAGKSTLVNILSGALQADAGTLELAGQAYAPASPRDAARHGVVTVHQSTDRVGAAGQRVADVLLLDRFASGDGALFVSRRSIRKQALDVLAHTGFALDVDADFGDLGAADRQLVAIARAVAAQAKVLILDEPTASLSQAEAERLFAVLRDLKTRGIAILYISHRMADLQAIADRVVVLRGGVVAADFVRPVPFDAAVEAMIGRPLASARVAARPMADRVVLDLRGVRLLAHSPAFDLQVCRGEVVAITGHLGAGKSRLLRALFGLESLAAGSVELQGQPYAPRGPQEAIASGVGLAGEDRHRSSLLPAGWPGATVAGTIALPHLHRWFPRGWLRPSVERKVAQSAITRLGIRTRGPDAPMETLSGGNQQKVVLARWQSEPQHLMLLDEPFQGVDVGARADIIAALRADTQTATLIATSDPEEALEVADRIYVIQHHDLQPASEHGSAAVLV